MADSATLEAQLDEAATPPAASSCISLDPRIRRTRELLQQALVKLLETQDFDRISVQHITEAATVNRATFYAHYPDKFALLECVVAARFQALLAARGVVFDGACAKALQGIVLGVCDYLAQTLNQPSRSAIDRHLEPHLESAIVAVVRRIILEGSSSHPSASAVPPAMLASTTSWAIYGAAKEWVHTPGRPSSEAVVAQIVTLVAPLLQPAAA